MAPTDRTAEPKRLIAERRYADAIVACRQLLLTAADDADLRILLGQALLAEERFDDVRVEMLAVLRGHPELGPAHRVLGEAFLRSGQKERAEDSLRRALDLSPDDEQTRELLDELAEEKFPVAQTIERWFGEGDDGRTVETESPAFEEEHTPVPVPVSTFAAPRELSVPAGGAKPMLFEPSIQIDPELAAEAERLAGEPAGGVRPDGSVIETADTTMPGPPPVRGEGLRQLLERATPASTKKPVVPKPARPDVAASARGPDGTQVARAGAQIVEITAPPLAPPPRPAPAPLAKVAPAPAPSPPARALDTAESLAPADAGVPTSELSLVELEERMSDQVPVPEPDSDELDMTRPLPPLSVPAPLPPPNGAGMRSLASVAPPRAAAPPPSAAPPPRSIPPARAAPPARADADPRSLPSFGPPAPFPSAIPASPAGIATALVPLPAASEPAGRPVPLGQVSPLLPTAPEIHVGKPAELGSSMAPPVVPPTSVHAPVGFAEAPAAERPTTDRRKMAIGAGAAAFVGIALITMIATSGPTALETAVATASDDGRPASYDAALALAPADGSGQERATRAFLLATTTLELGVDHTAEVDQLLGSLDADAAALPETRIARALVSLARGRGTQGLEPLSGLTTTGPIFVEAFRARALLLAQVGTLADAVDAARQAATLAPGSPRHAALYAELSVLEGDASGAQRVLDGIVGIDGVATLRLARAELGMLNRSDAAAIQADVDALLGPLVTSSTGPELGRAHLLRAQLALGRRDAAAARDDLELASTLIPGFDGRRRRTLAEAFLAAGAPARALEVAYALSGDTSDVAGRARIVVRAALAVNNVAVAETAVAAAGTGPSIDLLRARIAEAQGRLDEARQLFGRAAIDPTLLVEARTAEGRLYLAAGHGREAVAVLAQAIGAAPSDALAVLTYVRAALAVDDVAAAERAAAAAVTIDEDNPDLLVASALVARARGRLDLAYASYESAVAIRPSDGEMITDLGEVALALGRLDDAQRWLDAALALSPPVPRAALRLSTLALERGDLAGAEALIGRAGGASELEIARARARLWVAQGLGRSAIAAVTQLREGNASDPVLALALASLHVQAEEDAAARRFVAVALRADRREPEALVLSALVDIHEGRSSPARDSLATAEQSIASRGALPSVRARLLAVRGRLLFDAGSPTEARASAEEALRLDARCAEAHLVLADVEVESERSPVAALRSAVNGTNALGEVAGRLAIQLATGPDACALARRYLAIAPRGYDVRAVRGLLDGCPPGP